MTNTTYRFATVVAVLMAFCLVFVMPVGAVDIAPSTTTDGVIWTESSGKYILEITTPGEYNLTTGFTASQIVISTNDVLFKGNNHQITLKGPVLVSETVTSNVSKNKQLKFKLIRKHIGLVFQFPEYQLFEDNVLKDIMFGPKNFGMTKSEAEAKAKEVVKILNIDEELLDRSPFSLSGGQMRRVAIAGILASNPNILILDEPTVGLDPRGKNELMELLLKIQKETHKSIIMISHDMNVVAKYATRVIVMKKGDMVYNGPKFELFQDVDKLLSFNLGLPESAKIALELKNKGLLEFSYLPLDKDELESLILKQYGRGEHHE